MQGRGLSRRTTRTGGDTPGRSSLWTDNLERVTSPMSVQVYGCNHLAIEVDDVKAAVKFYEDVFSLKKLKSGEGDAFFQLGEHQFLAIFEVEKLQPDRTRHFGIMVRDEEQVDEVREKVTKKYG